MNYPLHNATLLLANCLLVAACSSGGGDSVDTPNAGKTQGLLSKVTNAAQFEQALKSGLKENSSARVSNTVADSALSANESGNAQSSYTSTYTLVEGVDEADILKYDGNILYAVDRGYEPYSCPTCLDNQEGASENEAHKESIKIFQTSPETASAEYLGKIESADQSSRIAGLYLPAEDQLMALRSGYSIAAAGDAWLSPYYWQEGSVSLSVYDTSNPESVSEQFNLEIEGTLVGSRRIGDKLYLVTRYSPNPNYPVAYEQGSAQANETVDALTVADMIPIASSDGVEQALFEPTDCYVVTDDDVVANSPVITSITIVPIEQPESNETVCYTGEAGGIYMSKSSLYLLAHQYNYSQDQSEDSTVIHKFALGESGVSYRGSGQVSGVLGYGEKMDYRLSEHDGYLRVVSTEYSYSSLIVDDAIVVDSTTPTDSVDHKLTILRESATAEALTVVSTLPNSKNLAEIGKPDERLYAVRFTDDRAYLVTFRNIDPLYVLDISDPAAPLIAGELEVPGFSDFIHPVSDDLLLTLGKDAEPNGQGWTWVQGLKLELFDVSDITQPQSADSLSIGGRYTDSPAIYDRHAFTYLAGASDNGSSDRFSIPINLYSSDGLDQPQWVDSALNLFEVANRDNASQASIKQLGKIVSMSSEDDDDSPSYGSKRSVIDGDAVYYYDSGALWAGFWSNPEAAEKVEM